MTFDEFLSTLAGYLNVNRGLLEDESRRLEGELYLYGEERATELKELVLLVATYDPGLAWEYFRNGHRIMGLSDPQIPVKLAALGCAVWQREPMMAPYVIRRRSGFFLRLTLR